jgi:hypothetical protein
MAQLMMTWRATIQACLVIMIFDLVIPWRHVFANFVQQGGDRWK